jgi:hypothetical protein
MRTLRYLNGVLTVMAVLLTLNVWTMWHTSAARDLSLNAEAQAVGRTSAGKQRSEMIGQLKQVNTQLGAMREMLSSGELVVQVKRPAQDTK